MNPGWFPLRIAAKRIVAPGIFDFELADPQARALPGFEPGSHLELKIGDKIRHYSLTRPTSDGQRYVLGVQREGSGRGGSRDLCDGFEVGHVILAKGPHNHFRIALHAHSHLLLAGGIGITPIICMAEDLWSKGAQFELHYSARSRDKMAYREYLLTAPYADRVRLYFDADAPGRRLELRELLGNPAAGRHCYFCGPHGMIEAVIAESAAGGWRADHIHFERFAAPALASANRRFYIEIKSTGQMISVPESKTAAEALAEAGIDVPTSCQQGVCGTCVTTVLAGAPEHRDVYLNESERQSNRLFTPCCSRALSDVLVLDL